MAPYNIVTCNVATCDKITEPPTEGKEMSSKAYRVIAQLVPKIQKAHIDMIVETREAIDEADIVNTLIYKHLKDLTAKDVLTYRRDIRGKD